MRRAPCPGAVLALLLLRSCAGAVPTRRRGDSAPAGHRRRRRHPGAARRSRREAGIGRCRPGDADRSRAGCPSVTLPCLGGGPAVGLGELRGPLVVNLFAQWCGAVPQELPYYERLHRDGKGKVAVVGIDYLDTQPDGALALARGDRRDLPLLATRAAAAQEFRIRGLPGLVFVDRRRQGRRRRVQADHVVRAAALAGAPAPRRHAAGLRAWVPGSARTGR